MIPDEHFLFFKVEVIIATAEETIIGRSFYN